MGHQRAIARMQQIVLEGISKLEKSIPAGNIAYIHRIDNVLFSYIVERLSLNKMY